MNFRYILLLFISGVLCVSCNENKTEEMPPINVIEPGQESQVKPKGQQVELKPRVQQEGQGQGGQKQPPRSNEPVPSSQDLFQAIKANDTAAVKKILDREANPNVVEEVSGYTPLHWAALNKNGELIQKLLTKGARVDEKTATGVTPLMLASFLGATEAVSALIKANADVNASLKSFTPVYFATIGNNLETVKLLVAAGAHVDQGQTDEEAVLFFANPHQDKTLKPLYDFLVSKKAKALDNQSNSVDPELRDKLLSASFFFEDTTLINFLAKNLTNIKDKKEDRVKKALQAALKTGNFRSGELLLKFIDAKKLAKVKENLLFKMSSENRPEAVKFLIKQGVDVNAKSPTFPSALYHAIEAKSPEIIKILLDAKASIDVKENLTPFFFAVEGGSADTLKELLLHKPDSINIKGSKLPHGHAGTWFKDCSLLAYTMLLINEQNFEDNYSKLEILKQSPNVELDGVQCIAVKSGETEDKGKPYSLKELFNYYLKDSTRLTGKTHYKDLEKWVNSLK